MKEKSLFKDFVAFVNKNVGKEITRKQLFELNSERVKADGFSGNTTIDSYRNIATKQGYIEFITQGCYKVLKPIPEDYVIIKDKFGKSDCIRKSVDRTPEYLIYVRDYINEHMKKGDMLTRRDVYDLIMQKYFYFDCKSIENRTDKCLVTFINTGKIKRISQGYYRIIQ